MAQIHHRSPHEGACDIDAERADKASGSQQFDGGPYDHGAGSDFDGSERAPHQAHSGGLRQGGSSRTRSRLVGVYWGRGAVGPLGTGGERRQFIPIDRIYAESLLAGADWDDGALRPLPKLIADPDKIRLSSDGNAIEAEFASNTYSRGYGISYEARLHRNGAPVGSGSTWVTDEISHDSRTASYTISELPESQRTGTFTVEVRMCVAPVASDGTLDTGSERCSGYYGTGPASVTIP